MGFKASSTKPLAAYYPSSCNSGKTLYSAFNPILIAVKFLLVLNIFLKLG
jgi:hypothetical protein